MIDTDVRPPREDSREFNFGPESEPHASPAAALARLAIEDLAGWLAHSPNNPSYLTSPSYTIPHDWLARHSETIEDKLTHGLDTLTLDNSDVDLWHIEMIRDGNIPHYHELKNEIQPLSPAFTISDFMNAGIEDILEKAQKADSTTPIEEMNEYAVDAIGAMLLRGHYFQRLSHEHPEQFTARECDIMLRKFQQNIISAIRRAARLTTKRSVETSEPVPAQPASAPEPIAA